MEPTVAAFVGYKTVLVLVWLGLFFAAERLSPAVRPERGWFGDWPRLVRNLIVWATIVILSALVVVPATTLASDIALWDRPAWWSGFPGLIADLVILDFWIFWWHRANHEVPVLWRFHEVHHLDRMLDVTTALRFHWGELLLSAAVRAAVMLTLAVPLASILVFEVLIQFATVFHHSNLRLPRRLESVLSRIVITPSIHWVHHHAVKRDTNSNYGTVLSVWDRLFRTRSPTRRTPELEIGVEHRSEQPWWRLLIMPFTARRSAG